jgi:hypothetical protein
MAALPQMETKETMEKRMTTYAPFAKASYSAPSGGDDTMAGYHIDKRFSNENRTLYASDTDPNKAVMSFRGTDIHNKNDLGTDALLALHMEGLSSRFQNGLRATKAAQSQYKDLTLTGHSAGASVGLWVSKQLKTPPTQTVAYSPHESWFQSLGDKFRAVHDAFFGGKKKAPSSTYIYKTNEDPVSAYVTPFYDNAHIATVRNTDVLNPHSMQNFMPSHP